MILRDQFINKLRELGYTYKRSGPNADLWRKKGSIHRVALPRRKQLAEATVQSILRQCGCSDEEIREFLRRTK